MSEATELLFSYGTLQLENVQLETFGRKLDGNKDVLVGYAKEILEISDEAVLNTSGERYHPILRFTGEVLDTVEGTVLRITPGEIAQADKYEVDDYKRINVTTKNGLDVWLYVAAN
jgi:gamma-glutamylcyclotransferase (GGCT)/AIG2-like uncharacterized protein YtfP